MWEVWVLFFFPYYIRARARFVAQRRSQEIGIIIIQPTGYSLLSLGNHHKKLVFLLHFRSLISTFADENEDRECHIENHDAAAARCRHPVLDVPR